MPLLREGVCNKMRTIKFRARHVKTGEWFYGTLHEGTTNNDLSLDAFWSQVRHGILDAETAGQWTGLFDKSSVEIYEGDVVELRCGGIGIGREFPVVWDSEDLTFKIGAAMLGGEDVEVVGNVHENPELAGGK